MKYDFALVCAVPDSVLLGSEQCCLRASYTEDITTHVFQRLLGLKAPWRVGSLAEASRILVCDPSGSHL